MTTGLFTNSNSRRDFVRNELCISDKSIHEIFIASAFFTEADIIQDLATNDRTIRLIVRLGFPTSPEALAKIMRLKSVQVRYYSDHSFHPKLYIFGDRKALVGSANLTRAALDSNQEVVVSIGADDERFSELASVFSEYWSFAKVLTENVLNKYSEIYKQHAKAEKAVADLDDEIEQQIGAHVFHNIGRSQEKQTAENIFLDSYRKTYQESVAAYRHVYDIYRSIGQRKFTDDVIPLRLELDSFLSFVRDTYTSGESWAETPLGWNDARGLQVEECVKEWHKASRPYFEETIVFKKYPSILKAFSNAETILATDDDTLFEALSTVHSFHDRLRFFDGGLSGVRKAFFSSNSADQIRTSLAYLIFGADEVEVRMANLIFNPEYKLNNFGQANVQELVGWINTQDLPVINGRTTKVLRYFGLDVRQL